MDKKYLTDTAQKLLNSQFNKYEVLMTLFNSISMEDGTKNILSMFVDCLKELEDKEREAFESDMGARHEVAENLTFNKG